MFLCPVCGDFHGQFDQAIERPWIREDDDTIDHLALERVVQQRRSCPEFQMKKCRNKNCAEYRTRIIERMKEEDDLTARRAAFNAELSMDGPKTFQQTDSLQSTQKKGYVYVIGGGDHFK